jgi:hypothetical protein
MVWPKETKHSVARAINQTNVEYSFALSIKAMYVIKAIE